MRTEAEQRVPQGMRLDERGRFVLILAKSKPERLCQVRGCKNVPRPDGTICWKCTRRQWRANNRVRAWFRAVKDRAARKGLEFRLTFDDFSAVAAEYAEVYGVSNSCAQLDRVDPRRGYVPGNIQVLDGLSNRLKGDRVELGEEDPF